MVALARQHGLVLHAHSDADAVERLFRQDPQARVLWAHSGFDRPEKVRELLRQHQNLWCDLAFRSEHGSGGKVPADGATPFTEFPDRFMVGTDTFTPERWHYIVEHAQLDARLAGRPAARRWPNASPGATPRRCSAVVEGRHRAMSAGPALAAAGGAGRCGAARWPAATRWARRAARRATRRSLLVYKLQPDPVPVGRHFAHRLRAVPHAATRRCLPTLRVDATMPEHRHGMNYRAQRQRARRGPLPRRRA